MSPLPLLVACLLGAEPIHFQRHLIAPYPAGYQVAVADLNGDGRPDVVALSTDADRVDWYENPGWQQHPIARTAKNIDLAVRDLNGDGHPTIALASGFYFGQSTRGGQIELLRPPAMPNQLWPRQLIAVDPVVHRLRWGDLDGDGRPELIHAPIFGPGSDTERAPKPAHLWAFRLPEKLDGRPWPAWKIDESLTVLHGIQVVDLDGDGRDEILTASYEGIFRFDFKGKGSAAGWHKVQLSKGAPPVSDKPGAARGTSEVARLRLANGRQLIVAIEPWHGHQVVVYSPPKEGGFWQRHVIDETLHEGHALAVADFDGDGVEEFVAGWRAGGGGLRLYKAVDADGREFKAIDIDPAAPAECAVAADINGDGKPDLVVSAGRANQLLWYENLTGGRASAGRNRAAWLPAAKYGVFVHFLGSGPQWNQKVNSFDVDRFATQMAQARAGYVVFTLGQNSGYYCSPNATYDKYTGHRPGERCSRRDLPMELARALKAHGIPLMLYLPSRSPQNDTEAMKGLADVPQMEPAPQEFTHRWSEVIREWSLRYGNKVVGWWFDGSYNTRGWDDLSKPYNWNTWAAACRAGNPKSILAFNPGTDLRRAFSRLCRQQDYTAGEQNSFEATPARNPAAAGLAWHVLGYLGTWWTKADGPRLSDAAMIDYVRKVNRQGGAVTIDVHVDPDGTVFKPHLRQLRAIAAAIRGL